MVLISECNEYKLIFLKIKEFKHTSNSGMCIVTLFDGRKKGEAKVGI